MLPATGHLACEQALLFGRAKRAARERASEREAARDRPPLSRLFSRASRASTFLDIPQMESLVAGYWTFSLKIQKDFERCCECFCVH